MGTRFGTFRDERRERFAETHSSFSRNRRDEPPRRASDVRSDGRSDERGRACPRTRVWKPRRSIRLVRFPSRSTFRRRRVARWMPAARGARSSSRRTRRSPRGTARRGVVPRGDARKKKTARKRIASATVATARDETTTEAAFRVKPKTKTKPRVETADTPNRPFVVRESGRYAAFDSGHGGSCTLRGARTALLRARTFPADSASSTRAELLAPRRRRRRSRLPGFTHVRQTAAECRSDT